MKQLIHDDFLLRSPMAQRLYHGFAEGLPIIDYHSHLNPNEIASDSTFADMTALWIRPDQYKHRAMRSLGVDERYILGDATSRQKFDRWAACVPLLAGNPLFHWTALELKNYFKICEPLSPSSCARIWDCCNAMLQQPSHSARQLLLRANAQFVCSSDRWLDDLKYHAIIADSGSSTRVVPSLRADDAFAVDAPGFVDWVQNLGLATGIHIDGLEAFEQALRMRLDQFAASGCVVSDHGIDTFSYCATSLGEAAALLKSKLSGAELTADDVTRLQSYLLVWLGREYSKRNWVMLLHIGACRDTNTRLRNIAGPQGGFATIGSTTDIQSLCRFLDHLDRDELLPRTVLFNLNPTDNEAFATLTGSYAQQGVAGKVQFGPAWWFNDHDIGIRAHLDSMSRYGLLANFIGMTTDSRSILSMSRHEYFRRIFCDWIAGQADLGIFPMDEALLADYVRRVCYQNGRNWFLTPNRKVA